METHGWMEASILLFTCCMLCYPIIMFTMLWYYRIVKTDAIYDYNATTKFKCTFYGHCQS